MKRAAILAAVLILCAGCSAKVGNSKLGSSRGKIARQMAPVETKSDVRAAFGTPNLIFEKDGAEYYEYKTVRGHGRYHWILPVVGWVMSWWQDAYVYSETNLFVAFDDADNVTKWDVIQTRGTAD